MSDDKTNSNGENSHNSNIEQSNPRIILQPIEDEMKKSYLDYAMSVIVGRALPDVRDGLKPVHRRILYAMNELSNTYNKPYKKCARIVGEVLGKYHPHGDVAVYDSLVRMAQDFSLRYPLIQGQGNFGSIDADAPAAMRYCVTGDSLIVTDKGLIRIDTLSEKEDINIKVLSKDKIINTASKFFDSGNHPTLKLTTQKGYELRGTYNHPILTLVKGQNGKPEFSWKLLEEIQLGDFVVIDRSSDKLWPIKEARLKRFYPNISKTTKVRNLPHILNEDLAYILGAFISEGTISKNKIEFCNTDKSWIDNIKRIWHNLFPDITLHEFKKRPSSYGKKEYYRLECHALYVIEFLSNLGLNGKSNSRQIPDVILKSTKNVTAAFLRSYFEGDGSISSSHKMIELSCCSKSENLINKLQIILLRYGIDTFKRFDKYKLIWKLYIRGHRNILRFYKEVGFISDNKNKKLEFIIHNYKKDSSLYDYVPFISEYVRGISNSSFISKNNFDRYGSMNKNYEQVSELIIKTKRVNLYSMFEYLLTYNYLFEKVVSLQESGIQRVFSIKVDSKCHSFISNGFISHNTEARLARISDEMLQDIEKETVDFSPNFDGTLQEPTVLPSMFPNLLVNGSAGIAVGMATNIPPHNLTESCNAIIATIDNPQITIEELCSIIQGPDFPTGAEIIGRKGIIEAYTRGKGALKIRSVIDIEQKKDKKKLVVKQIPYQVNKAQLVEDIAKLVKDKKISDISDLRDESDRDGIRIVIELKKDANPEIVKNLLYNFSRLEDTFGINMVALVGSEPKLLSLKSYLQNYVGHRITIVRKRCMYELRKAEERAHILEGLKIALKNIDAVVALIKKSKSSDDAKKGLIESFSLSELQSQAILDMRLSRIAALEQEKINIEYDDLLKTIKELKDILGSEQRIRNIIKGEMRDVIEKYGGKSDPRRTRIIDVADEELDFEVEDLIPDEPVVITITRSGYIKRMPLEFYKVQNRGGRGIMASDLKEEDYIQELFVAKTHSYLLIITNKGQLYWLKVYKVPDASRQSMGKAIVNVLELDSDEKINAVIPVKEFDDKHFLVMATKQGTIKKTNLIEFSNPRKGGILAINIDESKDDLVNVLMTDGTKNLMLCTKHGQAARFDEEDVRPTGRNSSGVRGVRLEKDDEVISMIIADEDKQVLTLTENGYGKRTAVQEYRKINRGGKGVINIICSERNGNVVAAVCVKDTDEVMLISKKGILIRTTCDQISSVGRNTQGVRLMKLSSGDQAVNMTKIVKE